MRVKHLQATPVIKRMLAQQRAGYTPSLAHLSRSQFARCVISRTRKDLAGVALSFTMAGGLGDHASFCWPAGWFAVDRFGRQCYNRTLTVAASGSRKQAIQ
jgi:hypothetical protein